MITLLLSFWKRNPRKKKALYMRGHMAFNKKLINFWTNLVETCNPSMIVLIGDVIGFE